MALGGEPREKSPRKMILNAFVEMCSGHQSPGLWKHPLDTSSNFNSLKHWTDLARLLEDAKFHGIFIADVLGGYDVYGGPKNLEPAIRSGAQWPVNEPLCVVPAMAGVTESIGFGVTISTSYEMPFHLARRLSTVDHLTEGRLAWNVVTSYLDSAARNLGSLSGLQAPHSERYARAQEYMDVVYKLWQSSWRLDATQLSASTNTYTSPSLVREIDHKGEHFTVPGPHICAPSPQRTPVIMQAGTSPSGRKFAAEHAEAVFVSGHSPASVAGSIAAIRKQAVEEFGRKASDIRFLAKMCPVLGRTRAEAEEKYKDYVRYGDREGALALFGGWTGVDMAPYGPDEELRLVESNAIRSYISGLTQHGPKVGKWTKTTLADYIMVGGLGGVAVGTGEEVADEMERWMREADVDGFNLAYAILPGTFVDVRDLLLPVLRKRGLFWEDYEVKGGTYRENLRGEKGARFPVESHPAAKYAWDPPMASTMKGGNGEKMAGPDGDEGVKHGDGNETVLDPMSMQLG